jgi:nitrogen fixation protein FixH
MLRETSAPGTGRRLTGRTVLLILIGFFLIVSIANGVMIRAAVSTFSGVETGSAYQAGLAFERDVEDARAQDTRHWQVSVKVRRTGERTVVEIDARDAAGRRLTGLEARARFSHPTDRRADRAVALSEDASGHFRGAVDPVAGQWDVVIELSRGGERMFRSRNRVVLN